MKSIFFYTLLISVVLLSCKGQKDNSVTVKKPNYIDSIQTKIQIEKLIASIGSGFDGFTVNDSLIYDKDYLGFNCKKCSDTLNVKPWAKADFDKNGLTDLMVVGIYFYHFIMCVLDKGAGHYELRYLTRGHSEKCTFPIVDITDSLNTIKYYYQNEQAGEKLGDQGNLIMKQLVYRFDDFVELNQNVTKHAIEKIEFQTLGCFGKCPIFKIAINNDKTSIWEADSYNTINDIELKGIFNTKIGNDKYQEIIDILNYINFDNLSDSYEVSWSDAQSCEMKITYDNGKTKKIKDYGMLGTFGLERVYQLLYALRENQQWVNK